MQNRRIKSIHIIMILLTVITIIALTFVGILGALYINEKNEVVLLQNENKKLQEQLSIPVFSVEEVDGSVVISEEKGDSTKIEQNDVANENSYNQNVSDDEIGQVLNMQEEISAETNILNNNGSEENRFNQGEEYIAENSSTEVVDNAEIQELLMAKENEIENSIKEKMKELVAGSDGSPLKMLRSFFPENLIYYDNQEYVFEPVLESAKKHNLISENFVETDSGEMQYVENGVVTSHKGIDVSKYQGNIDWNAVKSDGVEYAFIRLGLRGYESGKIVTDEYFLQNIEGANSASVDAGVYFFTQAINVEEAREEAKFVIDAIADYDISCPVVFDVEMITTGNGRANNLSKEERTDICIAFCEEIKQAGYTPMIYGNVKCFTKMVDMSRLEDYEKWYAFYDDYMYFPYEVSCWQYTEKGRVNGIKGDVDLNISYKLW